MEESSRIEDSVIQSLDSLKCCYEWIPVHPDYADTISFCDKYGYDLDHSGNTILIVSKRGEKKYSACIVKGSDKLDVNKKVKSLMEVKRLSFASPVETNDITGMMIGGVTIFGLPLNLPIYLDDKIIGRTTSGNYSFNFEKNLAFGYVKIEQNMEYLNDKSLYIEVEKKKFKATFLSRPLNTKDIKNK